MLILFDHGVPAPLVPYLIRPRRRQSKGRRMGTGFPTTMLLAERSGLGSTFFLPLTKNIRHQQQNLAGRK